MGMRRSRRLAAVAMTAAALGLLAVGCSSGETADSGSVTEGGTFKKNVTKEDDGPPQPGGKLSFGLNAETDGWNPTSNRWAGSGYIVGFSIMDPLAAYDVDLNPRPYLAESFDHNADFTQWTIKLRKGVTFQDGTAVNAAAVKKNLEAHRASVLTQETMAFVSGIETPDGADGLTVVVNMSKPWSTFLHLMTAQPGAVAAPSMLDSPEGNRNPVGSGPFTFVSWDTNKALQVKKNPNYWRKDADGNQLPYLDNIEFRIVADIGARSAAIESGGVNMFETWDPQQILDFTTKAEEGRYQMFTDQKTDGSKIFVGVNVSKEPFDDPIARQAVAYAADPEVVSETGFSGVFPPAYGVFSENSPFWDPSILDNYPKQNIEKAKELAAQYEAKHGKPIEFTANIIPNPEIVRVGELLKEQESAAGITVNLSQMSQTELIVKAITGDYQATGFILFGSPHLDREYAFIASQAKPAPELSLNFTRIGLNPDGSKNGDNDKLVAAMNEARTTDDRAKQKEQYTIVQQEMLKNLNFLFLVRQASAIIMDNNVRGALKYTLPGGQEGMPTTQVFTYNLWLKS